MDTYWYRSNNWLYCNQANPYYFEIEKEPLKIEAITRYCGLGDRHQQNGVNYTLDLATGLTQVLSDGTNTYLYGNGRIAQASNTTEYFLGDALGSVRQLADTAGAVTLTQNYAPYGETISSVGSGISAYQFTGESRDANGLTYLRARYYNSGDGRFISRDTWNGDYNRPLSLNRWGYVEGNPVNLVDPSGHFPEWCKSMEGRLLYENCVRDYYNLSAPKNYPVMPPEKQEGVPSCWSGPVAYKAPGYLEGASIGGSIIINGVYANEVVYNFGTMEKQRFHIGLFGLSTQIGGTFTEYQGVVFNFNNIDSLEDVYKGVFIYGSIGAGTGFPGLAQFSTGVSGFHSLTNEVWGLSQYYSFSLGVGVLSVPFAQIGGEAGGGYGIPGKKYRPYINQSSGKVNTSQLVSDITLGKNSPAIVPVPSVLVRGFGIEFAYYYGWIRDEIHISSK